MPTGKENLIVDHYMDPCTDSDAGFPLSLLVTRREHASMVGVQCMGAMSIVRKKVAHSELWGRDGVLRWVCYGFFVEVIGSDKT